MDYGDIDMYKCSESALPLLDDEEEEKLRLLLLSLLDDRERNRELDDEREGRRAGSSELFILGSWKK